MKGSVHATDHPRWYWAVLPFLGVTILVSVATGMLGPLWYAFLLACIAAMVLWHPVNAFVVFVVLTPIHTLGMILVYRLVGTDGLAMTLFLAWKEIVLLGAFVSVFVVLGRGTLASKPIAADWLALAYIMLATAYVALPQISGDPSDLQARLYGFRESLLPPLVYLVARGTPCTWDRLNSALRVLVVAALVWSAVGLMEAFVDPGDFLRTIGYTDFQVDVLGAAGELNAQGLAYTYTTSAGIRRVGSVFLHPLGFAIALLFVLPLLVGRMLDRRHGYVAATLIAVGALFATLSRGPLAVFVLSVALLLLWRGQLSLRSFAFATFAILGVCLPFLFVGPLRQLVIDTVTAQDGSTLARLADWGVGLLTFAAHPLVGTGVSSATPGDEVHGAESELLQIGLRFGWVGLSLYLLLVANLVLLFWRHRSDQHRTEFIWAGVSMMVLNLYGSINPLWRSGFHTLVIWFAWGLLATRALKGSQSAREATEAGAHA